MTAAARRVLARDVRVGDRLLLAGGDEMTVTRIDIGLLGRPDLIAFVEDSDVRWLKLPRRADAEVELARGGDPR